MDVNKLAQIIDENNVSYLKVLKRALLNPALRDPFGVAQGIVHRIEGGMTQAQFEAWLLSQPEGREANKPQPKPPDTVVPMKTRDQVKAVMSNYCNLLDSRGIPQFSPFVGGHVVSVQDDWIENEVRHGSTHFYVSVDVNGYPALHDPDLQILNFFTENRWQEFGALLQRLFNRGLTPVVFAHSGDTYAGSDYYSGFCLWWNVHFGSFTEQVVGVNGWETRRRGGGHTALEFNRSNLLLRQGLGDKAILAAHLTQGDSVFSSHAPEESDDPWLGIDEPDVWYQHCGSEFEVLLFQNLQPTDDAKVDEFGQPLWWNRAMDVTERFRPQGTPLPLLKGKKQRDHEGNIVVRDGTAHPDWFARSRKRGRPVLVAAESVAWQHSNQGGVSEARAKEVAQTLKSMGFEYFGNGLP